MSFGGRTRTHGALVIRDVADSARGAWEFHHFGPSYACNPIPPDSRFRLSGWIRADKPAAASLQLNLTGFNGSAMFSSRQPSVSTGAVAPDAPADGAWRRIEFVSEPAPSYTLAGHIVFAYTGPGEARLCELRVERL